MTGAGRDAPGPSVPGSGREVRSLRRGLTALGLINAEHAMSIAQLAHALGLPRTTAERLLHTLVTDGYLERTPDDKQYRPTAKVLTLSSGFVRPADVVEPPAATGAAGRRP